MVVPVDAENTEDQLLIDSEPQLIRVKIKPQETKVQTQILESKPPMPPTPKSRLVPMISPESESDANENGSDLHLQFLQHEHEADDDLDGLNSFHYFQLTRIKRVPNGGCLQRFFRSCSCIKFLNCCCSLFSPPWSYASATACDCSAGGSSDARHLLKIEGTVTNSDDVNPEEGVGTKSTALRSSDHDRLSRPTIHLLGLGSRRSRAVRSRAILCDSDNSVHVDVGLDLRLDQGVREGSGVPTDNFHTLFNVHMDYYVGSYSTCFGVPLCAFTADGESNNDITAHVEISSSNRILGSFSFALPHARQAHYDHNHLQEKSKPKRRYRIECWNGKQIHVERQRSPFTGYDYLFTNITNGQQEQIIAEMKSKPSISSIEMVHTLNSVTPSDLKGTWIKTVLLGFMIALEVIS